MAAGIEPREVIRGQVRNRAAAIRGAIYRTIVVHDDHAVARQVDVELEPISAQRHPVVEGEQRVLGAKRRAAAVGKHLGAPERERGVRTRHAEDLIVCARC